tara:strand:+ start:81736 stop:82992 length:1257 start_codon:yes stop_codon:yes gene_type:complete
LLIRVVVLKDDVMKKWIFGLTFMVFLSGCREEKQKLALGSWLMELQVMDHQKLPFNFKLAQDKEGEYSIEIYNADETIVVDEITVKDDSIEIKMPVFEGYFKGTFTPTQIKGDFVKESLDRIVPFVATFNVANRFSPIKNTDKLVSGVWEAYFSPNTPDEYAGKGLFVQNGNIVTGTFRTTTGDYRFLEGIISGDSLKLSAFDGSHAFLFTAKVTDSSLNGMYYSGNHFKEPFMAKRNEVFELPDEDSLTYLNEGFDKLNFSFPDLTGKMTSLTDARFKNKPLIIQIMGTWCPNCLDETKFLVDFNKNNKDLNIEMVALAFEYAKTKEKAFKSIERLKNRIEVPYPILLAQYGSADKQKAQEKLPMLNHVLSYPTTIFIDKKGMVRKIKTGFNGPATGDKFVQFKKEFKAFVTELANE